jgi:hypothetical protein
MSLHFKKQAVPLQVSEGLLALPSVIGPWHQLSLDDKLNHEMEEVLQTKEYVFRYYVDASKVGYDVVAKYPDMTIPERQAEVQRLIHEHPDAIINCAVTYYTGGADTVAHIPDRCYVADGYQPVNPASPTWSLGNPASRDLRVRYITFEDQGSNTRAIVTRSVAYFFQCNGEYLFDPNAVRARLQTLTERYGYYAKIELMTLPKDRKDPSQSSEVMKHFLSHALPEIENILPDWQKFKASRGE